MSATADQTDDKARDREREWFRVKDEMCVNETLGDGVQALWLTLPLMVAMTGESLKVIMALLIRFRCETIGESGWPEESRDWVLQVMFFHLKTGSIFDAPVCSFDRCVTRFSVLIVLLQISKLNDLGSELLVFIGEMDRREIIDV